MENMDDLHEQGVVCRIFLCLKLSADLKAVVLSVMF